MSIEKFVKIMTGICIAQINYSFVLSDLELCAKLLGYQAIGMKSSDGKNEWRSFRIVDPGCVSILMEITDQPDLNFDEIVKKI